MRRDSRATAPANPESVAAEWNPNSCAGIVLRTAAKDAKIKQVRCPSFFAVVAAALLTAETKHADRHHTVPPRSVPASCPPVHLSFAGWQGQIKTILAKAGL